MSIPTRQEFEAQIVARAWKDEAFDQALLDDPRAAISRSSARRYRRMSRSPSSRMPTTLSLFCQRMPMPIARKS